MLSDLSSEQKLSLAVLGRYVKGVAHNINTPLSAIMGRAEMLQMRLNKLLTKVGESGGKDDLEKCLRDVTLIIDNSTRVTDIVKNMMQKSINAESYDVQTLNIGVVLREDLEFLKANMDYKHNIEKNYQIDENIPSLNGRFIDFSNSFLEILHNSIQAMLHAEEKRMTVTAAARNKTITVCFQDTGCGINADTLEGITGLLSDPPDAFAENCHWPGMQRVAIALRPYRATYTIESSPGDTSFTITFPL